MFQIPTTVEIADGRYPAVVEAIESGTGSFGPQRKWSFLVEHQNANGQPIVSSISTITSANTGPRSTSYQFLKGLLGRELRAGENIEDPTGTRCFVDIVHNDKGFPKVAAVYQHTEPQQTLPGVPR